MSCRRFAASGARVGRFEMTPPSPKAKSPAFSPGPCSHPYGQSGRFTAAEGEEPALPGVLPAEPPRRRLRRWWSRSWIRWPRRWCCRQARRGSPPSSTALGLLLCLCSASLPRCCPLKVMGWQVMGWIVPPRRGYLRRGTQQRSEGSCTWGVSLDTPPWPSQYRPAGISQ